MLAGKTLLEGTNLFSPNDYKKNGKKYINILKISMIEEARLEFRLRKIIKSKMKLRLFYLLDEIKQWFNEWKM